MKLIAGLGNPGRKYLGTRHNVGFEVLAAFVKRHGGSTPRDQFKGEVSEAMVGGEKVIILAPSTYMNNSGDSVRLAFDFYKPDLSDVLVVCDDFSLPLCRLRFRKKGSSGGQKGLKDIINKLGTDEISRLRFGIDPPPERWDIADYVLSKFKSDEREDVDCAVVRAADSIKDWVEHDTEYCMNAYNSG